MPHLRGRIKGAGQSRQSMSTRGRNTPNLQASEPSAHRSERLMVASQILCKLKIAQNRIYNFKRVAGGKTGRSFAYIIQENQSMSSSLSLSEKKISSWE